MFLEGEKSDVLSVKEGVTQGCSLFKKNNFIFINDTMMRYIEKAGLEDCNFLMTWFQSLTVKLQRLIIHSAYLL